MIHGIMHPSPQRHTIPKLETVEVVFSLLADQPVLFLFPLIGIDITFGHTKVEGIGLGAAIVLFLTIALAAWAQAYGIELTVTKQPGTLGLTPLTFTIGISSGASFLHNLKIATGPILAVVPLYILIATIDPLVDKTVGMDIVLISGTFTNTVTNTPALNTVGEASGDLATATVGYSIAYLFDVIDMLIASMAALAYGKNDRDQPSPLASRTIRVKRDDHPLTGDIYRRLGSKVTFSHLRRGETDPIIRPSTSDTLDQDDLMTAVGPCGLVAHATTELSYASSHSLIQDRSYLNFRRVTVSDPKVAGQTITDLDFATQFSGAISCMRRGDINMVAEPSLVLQQGDRVRVVTPTSKMETTMKFFGDSTRGLSDLNPIVLGLDMALGIAIGKLLILTLSGEYFSVGSAAGTLIVDLVLGRLDCIRLIMTALPFTTNQIPFKLGLLTFLAQADANAGKQIVHAFTSGTWAKIAVLGFIMTMIITVGTCVTIR